MELLKESREQRVSIDCPAVLTNGPSITLISIAVHILSTWRLACPVHQREIFWCEMEQI